ncbi:MAG: DUF4157 domain-containing protein [Anaerolineae bacterium]
MTRLQQQAGNARISRLVEEGDPDALQRFASAAGGPVSNRLASRIYSQLGKGTRLSNGDRMTFEQTYGETLDDVRLHTDAEADALSRSVGARAFTLGRDIFFSRQAAPSNRRLLAHELAHVLQQRGLPTGSSLQVGPADDALEREAQATADATALAADTVSPNGVETTKAAITAGPTVMTPTVQRDWLDDLGTLSGVIGTGSSILQGTAELANLPLAREMGTSAASITNQIPGAGAIGGLTSIAGSVTGTRDMLNEDKPWYERGIGGMSAFSGATGLAGSISSMFGSSLFAAGGSAGLTAGAGSALTGGGAGLATGAGAATALGSLGAVLGAGAAGYGAGRALDEGVGALGRAITGDEQGDYTISGGLAGGMTALDQALTPLWADENEPEYTQTLGWKLGEWLGI